MTVRGFFRQYQQYKDLFDLETAMRATNKTYKQLEAEQMKAEEWF